MQRAASRGRTPARGRHIARSTANFIRLNQRLYYLKSPVLCMRPRPAYIAPVGAGRLAKNKGGLPDVGVVACVFCGWFILCFSRETAIDRKKKPPKSAGRPGSQKQNLVGQGQNCPSGGLEKREALRAPQDKRAVFGLATMTDRAKASSVSLPDHRCPRP